ncbi:MAG: DUF2490 domain-containing protein [Flavobacteriaceae bacterium]|nr:DUF2490 domain-containing protein [Flavobacteriaceae bacterium]
MKNYLLISIIILGISFQGLSQNNGETELGSWYMYSGSHKLSNKWNLKSLMQVRTYETTSDFNIFFAMAGGSYRFNKNLSTSINYGFAKWDRSFLENDNPDTIEHRINESLGLSSRSGDFAFLNRIGLDHRFIDNFYNYETQHRIRYKLNVKHPISKTLYVSVFDEVFYNLDQFQFQQNRLYGALGIRIVENYNFELGYMKWSFKTRSYNRLQIGISIRTDWSKKEARS